MTTRADSADRRGKRAPRSQAGTERAGTVGAIAGLIAAVPLIGPALVAGCLSCIGIGAAAGVASTSALPPRWWLVGLGVATGAVAMLERQQARRCRRTGTPLRAAAVLVAVAATAWLVTRFALVPAVQWAIGTGGTLTPGAPVLP